MKSNKVGPKCAGLIWKKKRTSAETIKKINNYDKQPLGMIQFGSPLIRLAKANGFVAYWTSLGKCADEYLGERPVNVTHST